ncbi:MULTISPECIES: hypothetical protein [Lacticaseibacillus]|uniref:Uncharacterized protein n=2 Tax=Lacticaseibacillus TaxID=2759736 RepID=A0ABW4CED7_9LACO|nr:MULTISPECIES: hypothetical protein [Lacticaseibacillus]
MDEIVFFNPGDAVARDHDFQAARRSAEVFKVDHPTDQGLVVGKDDSGEFAVFYEAAGMLNANDYGDVPASKYTILAHL